MNINTTKRNWIKNPTKKEVAIVFISWLVGGTLVFLAGTDFFKESFFLQKNLVVGFLVIIATIVMLIVAINYYKSNS